MSSQETAPEEVIVEAEVLSEVADEGSEGNAETRSQTPYPIIIAIALAGVGVAAGLSWFMGQQMAEENRHASAQGVENRQQIGDLQGQISQTIGQVVSQQEGFHSQQNLLSRQQQAFDVLKTRTESALQQQEQMIQQLLHSNREQSRQLNQSVAALARRVDRRESNLHTAAALRLLQIAEEQLMIVKDLESTQQALAQAGQQITASGDPILLPIHALIQQELKQVRETSTPDLHAVLTQLRRAAESVDTLPLVQIIDYEQTAPEEAMVDPVEEGGWNTERILQKVWQDLLSLIRIEKKEQELPVIASQSEKKMSRLILKLRLEQAQSTLLMRDTPLFVERIEHALAWLGLFDRENEAVAALHEQLIALSRFSLGTELPTIGEAHRRLRAILAQRNSELTTSQAVTSSATSRPPLTTEGGESQ